MARGEWVYVDGLKRKLELAVRKDLASDWDSLASKLGNRKEKTLRGWTQGSTPHAPDEIPPDAFEDLVALFNGAMPEAGERDIRGLLLASAEYIENAFEQGLSQPMFALIEQEAVHGEAVLIRSSEDLGLSEVDIPEPDGLIEIELGERFRIEFRMKHRLRHAIALQNAGRRWGAHSTAFDLDRNVVHMPDFNGQSIPYFLREREQEGLHRFYCIHSAHPLPTTLREALREPFDLDRRTLSILASFYGRLPRSDRAIQLCELRIVRPDT